MKSIKLFGAAALCISLTGCQAGAGSETPLPSESATQEEETSIAVFGSITVPPIYPVDKNGRLASGLDDPLEDGGECRADDGYSDITEGGQVTVTNGSGDIIGIGRLEAGRQQLPFDMTYSEWLRYESSICAFDFLFDVPKGEGFYSVSIGNGNRGEITYTESEIGAGVFLTLGD